MIEIKTIKGKVEFVCVSTDSTEEWKISGTNYLCVKEDNNWQAIPPRLDDGCRIISKLSTITEEQASLLAKKDSNRKYYLYIGSDNNIFKSETQTTAKESLFSLLKANGCWTKEMRGDFIKAKARAGRPIDILDKTEYPDDYLLIIKQ